MDLNCSTHVGLSYATTIRYVLLHMASQDWSKHRPFWAIYQFYSKFNFINKPIQKNNNNFYLAKLGQENSSLNGWRGFSWGADQLILGVPWCMGSTGQEMYRKTDFHEETSRQIFINFHIFDKTFWNLYVWWVLMMIWMVKQLISTVFAYK